MKSNTNLDLSYLFLLLSIPCVLSILQTVHFKANTYAEGSFSLSKEIDNVHTHTECISWNMNGESFTRFDSNRNLCMDGTVDTNYSGSLSNEINLFSGKSCLV